MFSRSLEVIVSLVYPPFDSFALRSCKLNCRSYL
jgi:hypothetical protein